MKKIYFSSALAVLALSSSAVPAFARGAAAVVPEPGTFVLLGVGAVGLVVLKKLKR